jgi:hypothetical protein
MYAHRFFFSAAAAAGTTAASALPAGLTFSWSTTAGAGTAIGCCTADIAPRTTHSHPFDNLGTRNDSCAVFVFFPPHSQTHGLERGLPLALAIERCASERCLRLLMRDAHTVQRARRGCENSKTKAPMESLRGELEKNLENSTDK